MRPTGRRAISYKDAVRALPANQWVGASEAVRTDDDTPVRVSASGGRRATWGIIGTQDNLYSFAMELGFLESLVLSLYLRHLLPAVQLKAELIAATA
jgi:hypothetical protein